MDGMTAAAWNFPVVSRHPCWPEGALAYRIDRVVFSLLPGHGMVEAILILGALAERLRRDGD